MNTFRKLRAFCRVLKGNQQWFGTPLGGSLRTLVEGENLMHFCPLTYALYVKEGSTVGVGEYSYAAERLGFQGTEGKEIAAASDCADSGHERRAKLRRILERACGLWRKEPRNISEII